MFLKQIDSRITYNYEFYLCRRDNREPIAFLHEAMNIVYKAELRNIDEIDMDIPYWILDSEFRKVKNKHWDMLKEELLIEMQVKIGDDLINQEYFIINKPVLTGVDKDIKHIHGYSYEYGLQNIYIRLFEGTRQLYKSPTDTVHTGQGMLNILEEQTYGAWKVGYVDPDAQNELLNGSNTRKYRYFSISEKTWLDFLRDELESAFDCIFEFTYDDVQKCNIIDVYHIDNYGLDEGLYVSENNYIDKLEQTINCDDFVTRLKVYGKDNLAINSVNLGRDYIDDFSYYRNSDYMSSGLLTALDNYDSLITTTKDAFTNQLSILNGYYATLITKQSELALLNNELKILLDDKDSLIASKSDLSAINQQIANKDSQIATKQGEINTVNSNITSTEANIQNLNNTIKYENNFTTEQLKELQSYIKEGTYQNPNYDEVYALLEAGKRAQKKMNEPLINLQVDLPNLLEMVESQNDWHKIGLGNVLYLEYTPWNMFLKTRIIGYTHDISNREFTIEISNRTLKLDSERMLGELSRQISGTSTTMTIFKDSWNLGKSANTTVNEYINTALDLAKQRAFAGRNQNISIDDRGITMKEGQDSQRYLRILNDLIVMTKDGGDTFDTAISPEGIVADKIYGRLLAGENLLIENEGATVRIDEIGLTVINGKLTAPTIQGGTIIGDEFQVGSNIALHPPQFIYGSGSGEIRFYKSNTEYVTMKYGSVAYSTYVTLNSNFRANIISGINITADGQINCNTIYCANPPWAVSDHYHSQFDSIGSNLNTLNSLYYSLEARVSNLENAASV